MKKLCLAFYLSIIFLLSGCTQITYEYTDTVKEEQPHLYWKDIECVVIDYDYRHWYASAHQYQADITVYSKEYDLTESFSLSGWDAKDYENLDVDDIVTCEMYSWVMDSTGEVIRREIHSIK